MRYFLAGIIFSATFNFTSCYSPTNLDYLYPDSTITIKYQDDYQFGEFHKRIKEFKNDPIGSNKIVFIGNSITYGLRRWDNKLEANNIVNRGISGDFSEGIQKRLNEIIYYKPLAVFIGSSFALILATLLGALAGGSIANLIPAFLLKLISGIVFLIIGINLLAQSRKESTNDR